MQLFLMNVTSRPESLAPVCQQSLLWHSMDKRMMFENCAVEHGTISFTSTLTVKFKYLPSVMVQEKLLVYNDPRASYVVTKSISLRMAGTSSVAKASDEAELTEDDIPCAALADPLNSRAEVVVSVTLYTHM